VNHLGQMRRGLGGYTYQGAPMNMGVGADDGGGGATDDPSNNVPNTLAPGTTDPTITPTPTPTPAPAPAPVPAPAPSTAITAPQSTPLTTEQLALIAVGVGAAGVGIWYLVKRHKKSARRG
jgi:lysozyme family protein